MSLPVFAGSIHARYFLHKTMQMQLACFGKTPRLHGIFYLCAYELRITVRSLQLPVNVLATGMRNNCFEKQDLHWNFRLAD